MPIRVDIQANGGHERGKLMVEPGIVDGRLLVTIEGPEGDSCSVTVDAHELSAAVFMLTELEDMADG